jgi:hypothetical protein
MAAIAAEGMGEVKLPRHGSREEASKLPRGLVAVVAALMAPVVGTVMEVSSNSSKGIVALRRGLSNNSSMECRLRHLRKTCLRLHRRLRRGGCVMAIRSFFVCSGFVEE